MTEAGFTRYIMSKLPKDIYKWKVMNMMQNGVPDCYFSGRGGDLWVEMKYVKVPKKLNTRIKINLSALQEQWLNGRSKEGRNVAVIIGSDIGCCILHKTGWDQSILKIDLTLDRQDIVSWICQQTRV